MLLCSRALASTASTGDTPPFSRAQIFLQKLMCLRIPLALSACISCSPPMLLSQSMMILSLTTLQLFSCESSLTGLRQCSFRTCRVFHRSDAADWEGRVPSQWARWSSSWRALLASLAHFVRISVLGLSTKRMQLWCALRVETH